VFVRSIPEIGEPRLEKEVRSLTTHGYQVTILAWDREGLFGRSDNSAERVVSRLRLRAPYGKSVIAAYYPFFWLWVLSKLLKKKPRVVHACDLDTVFPVLLYKFVKRDVRVVFDLFDSHAASILGKNMVAGRIILFLERFAVALSDALIVCSKERLSLYDGVSLKRYEIIGNFADLGSVPFDRLRSRYLDQDRKTFRLVYSGIIRPNRGIVETAQAIRDLDDVEFVVAGRIADRRVFDAIMQFPQVKYHGQLEFDKSLSLEGSADVLPVFYESGGHHRFSGVAPNKLYEAMMLGIPIITNLAHVLQDARCGIFAKYADVAAIRRAVLYLKEHPDMRRKMGEYGRHAFEKTYNWQFMENRLLALYGCLMGEKR
jgi:glycosyltransferase involved in cell wall biosynthesis